jgi:hypothetical protein
MARQKEYLVKQELDYEEAGLISWVVMYWRGKRI